MFKMSLFQNFSISIQKAITTDVYFYEDNIFDILLNFIKEKFYSFLSHLLF